MLLVVNDCFSFTLLAHFHCSVLVAVAFVVVVIVVRIVICLLLYDYWLACGGMRNCAFDKVA